jgi:hypothetical protein
MTQLAELNTLPDGVQETFELIGRVDDCLKHGFTRMGEAQRESLASFAGAFHGSPLDEPVVAAVDAITRSEFVVRHFLALAAARVALQGAQYDALTDQLCSALGRQRVDVETPAAISPGESSSALASTQQWLTEIALAGFAHLVEDSVAPFVATLEQLQNDARLTPIAVMATGYVNELLDHMPAERQPALPIFRWADLWSGLMVRTQHLADAAVGQNVSGSVMLLGVDVQSHRNFVNATVYGLLQREGASAQTVRIPFVGYKVDVLSGPEVWELFGKLVDPVLKALKAHKQLVVTDAELMPGGDLLLRATPKQGKAGDPFSVIEQLSALPAVPPLLRHPVQIAEIVHTRSDTSLPLDTTRLPPDCELHEEVLGSAEELIGLLRFDAGAWRIQPLAVKGSKSTVISGEGIADARAKRKSKTLSILTERAGKLLRDK